MARGLESETTNLRVMEKSQDSDNDPTRVVKKRKKQEGSDKKTPEMDLKSKYITTAVIYYCNVALGASNFVSLALIDFKNLFETDTQTISLVFTLSIVSMLIAATCFGVLYNYVNRHAFITFLLFLMSLAIFLMPYSPNLTIFYILNCISAISGGGWVTCQVVWIIEIWQEKASPFIQAQHFFYAIGSILPPLIFAPFLSSQRGKDFDLMENQNEVYNSTSLSGNSSLSSSSSSDDDDTIHTVSKLDEEFSVGESSGSKIAIPISITAAIVLASAVFQLALFCCIRNRKNHQKESVENGSSNSSRVQEGTKMNMDVDNDNDNENEDKEDENESTVRSTSIKFSKSYQKDPEHHVENGNGNFEIVSKPKVILKEEIKLKPEEIKEETCHQKLQRVLMIVLSAAFVGSFQSVESSAGQFIPIFSYYSSVGFSEYAGARLLFSYTLAFLLGRLLGVFVSFKVKPQFLLCVNLLVGVTGNGILLIWGERIESFMWVGVILLGLGYSTGVPSIFAFVSQYLEITNIRGSLLMVSGGVVASVYPIIVGLLIEKLPVVLMYTNFFSLTVGTLAFVSIVALTRRIRDKL